MAEPTSWRASSPLARIAEPVTGALTEARVFARPLPNLGLATVLARKGAGAALAARVHDLYGLEPPDRPQRAAAGSIAFVATGPGAWIAISETGAEGWAERLAGDLDGLASVSDQSDGYAAVRLEGPAVLDLLAKGAFLDLHASVFPVGSAAGLSIAHIGVVLWRREALVFELLTFRSYAQSFWSWIEESAAEYGLGVLPAAL